jgi:hypothetical protein
MVGVFLLRQSRLLVLFEETEYLFGAATNTQVRVLTYIEPWMPLGWHRVQANAYDGFNARRTRRNAATWRGDGGVMSSTRWYGGMVVWWYPRELNNSMT